MRLLVTGGAGYIGGFTTRLLLRTGHDVTVVDTLSRGHRAAAGDARLVVADFADRQAMGSLMREHQIEAVLHFAGLKSVAESWAQPERYREVNVSGTAALLDAMADAAVPMLVYSGSCAIYGEPSQLPVGESHPAAPTNPYGESKWLAEQQIRRADEDSGIRSCVLRYFNAAGAELDGSIGEDPVGAANLIPLVVQAASGMSLTVPIYGLDYPTPDGTAIRDYVHVLDLASAHLLALEYLSSGGAHAAINLGTGTGSSVREVIEAVEQASGHTVRVVEEGRRPGDPPAVWADPSLAAQVLGWRARFGIGEIVASAWHWHVDHPRGFA